jgi:peptide-methionine (S)-S-oxide reductase
MLQTIGFGGGCHWCTEAVFAALRGVHTVEQGFIRSAPPAETWSEAVRIRFDAAIIDLATLIDVHVRTHSAASDHALRSKYRSAVYTLDAAQRSAAKAALEALQPEFDGALVTRVLPLADFKASDGRFQRYYETGPEKPFCRRYIDPKLTLIRQRFAAHAA